MGNFLRTLTREEKLEKFIKQKMKEWIKKHGQPGLKQEEELKEQFKYEYFGGTAEEDTDGLQFARNTKLKF